MQLVGQTLLDRYQVIAPLGSGGFGDTYRAKDLALPGQPLCVVKHLKPKHPSPEVFATAKVLFEREAEILYLLGKDAAIPQLYAHFQQQGEFFLVQEFIEGHDLGEELQPGVCWPLEAVQALLEELLAALSVLHRANVIHRDIKPQNIMRRDRDRRLFLIDFGAVKEISQLTQMPSGQTGVTIAIGSPGYMPSEQAAGKPKPASDIYAVGIIAIQALTGLMPGQIPVDSATGELCWQERLTVSMGDPRQREVIKVIARMVRDHFSQRYGSAQEALEALQFLPKQMLSGPKNQLGQTTVPTASNSPTQVSAGAGIPTVPLAAQPPVSPPISEYSTQQRGWLWALVGGGTAIAAISAGLLFMPSLDRSITPASQPSSVSSDSAENNLNDSKKLSSAMPPSSAPPTVSQPPIASQTEEPIEATPRQPSSPVASPVTRPTPVIATTGVGYVFDPPSNIRRSPNGEILCSINTIQSIELGSEQGGWYGTTACGLDTLGYIHSSQFSFEFANAFVIDPPTNVRDKPNGNILCVLDSERINTFGPVDGWYRTNACASGGVEYVHESQIELE